MTTYDSANIVCHTVSWDWVLPALISLLQPTGYALFFVVTEATFFSLHFL